MTISSNSRKAGPFIGNGTAATFPFTFKVFQASDLEVVKLTVATNVETILVLNTDFTAVVNEDQNSNPGGSITLTAGALAAGYNLVITSDIENLQPTDLTNQGGFYPEVITDALDRATIQIQQLQEAVDRSAKLPITSSADADALVADIVRLADSADNIDTVANNIGNVNNTGNNIANVNTVAGSISNVNTVATNVASVNTTATNIASVNTVAADLNEPVSEIETVAGSITNVNNVGNNIANVNTVAGISANVTTVAGISANVTTVAGNSANVTTAATNIAAINTVASDLNEPVSEIDTVATNIANVNTVGLNIASVNTAAGNNANITTVATNIANVNTVATNIANVNSVAGNSTNINAVAGNSTNINAVATNSTNINTAATNIAAITTVANDLNEPVSEIDTVANSIANVNTVGTNIGSVQTVAGIAGDVNTVAGVAPNVTTVAGISGNVTTVAGVAANVTTVAGIAPNVTTVAGISADVTAVAGVAADIPTVAANVADISNFADVYQGAKSTPPTLRNDGSALQIGDLYFNSVSNAMFVYASTGWVPAGSSVNGTSRRFRYIATAGQTTFSGTDSNGNTMAYDAGFVDVYLNGVRLDQTDYTASSGTSIVLGSAAALNDELNIVAFGTFSVASINGVDLINNTVTYNKIQTVSAGKVLGRDTSGSGNVQELPIAVTTGGNVCIGSSSPVSLGSGYGTLDVRGSTGGGYRWGNSTDSAYTYADTDGAVIATATAKPLIFSTNNTERMRIDSAGRVTMPYQPAFDAFCSSNTTYNATSLNSVCIYNATTINTGSHYNTSNGLFTAPVSGWYEIFAGGYINSSDATQIWMIQNGSRTVTMDVKAAQTNDTVSGGGIVYLSANDTIGVHVYSPSAGTKTLIANAFHTFFRGVLLG
jgi:hypothetical protein